MGQRVCRSSDGHVRNTVHVITMAFSCKEPVGHPFNRIGNSRSNRDRGHQPTLGSEDPLYGKLGKSQSICSQCLTHSQTQRPGEPRFRHTLDAFRIIYRTDGWRAFYRGLVPSLFGVTHVVVQFPLYERLKEGYCEYFAQSAATSAHALRLDQRSAFLSPNLHFQPTLYSSALLYPNP